MYKWEREYRKLKSTCNIEQPDFKEEYSRLNEIKERLEQIKKVKGIIKELHKKNLLENDSNIKLRNSKVLNMEEIKLMLEEDELLKEENYIVQLIDNSKEEFLKRKEQQDANYKKIDNILEYIKKLQGRIKSIDEEIEIRNFIVKLSEKVEEDKKDINNIMSCTKRKKKSDNEQEKSEKPLEEVQDNLIKNEKMLEKINLKNRRYKKISLEQLEKIKKYILVQIWRCNFICSNLLQGKKFNEIIIHFDNLKKNNDFGQYIGKVAEDSKNINKQIIEKPLRDYKEFEK